MSTDTRRFHVLPVRLLVALALLVVTSAQAQQFAAMVSPPRFELASPAGKSQRQVIEITNSDVRSATYRVRTVDWTLDPNGAVTLDDALASGSCRPWVAIERREITVPAGGRFRFRFEVNVPPDARGECRFAIAMEGAASSVQAGPNISIPVSGQIAVIVYVTIGDAKPDLSILRTAVVEREGQRTPVMVVRNTGQAHGRFEGFLDGTDANGKRIDFAPSGLPILPGETREIPLVVASEAATRPTLAFPLTIRGNLEWGGKTTPLDARFGP